MAKNLLWIESGPLDKFAEAIRSLRETLFVHLAHDPHPLIVISAPHRGDGCTTVSVNLGAACAQTGKRVLLIDGDLREQGMREHFEFKENGDFIQVLEGGTAAPVSTGIDNLFFLPGGKPHAGTHPFDSPRAREYLQQCRMEYDLVLIDTAPVLESSDPIVLGQKASGIVLVFRAGNFQREHEIMAREKLERSGVKIIGAVINGVREEDEDPYYAYQRFLEMKRK